MGCLLYTSEMVLKNAPVTTLMTSFNKINGTFAGGSYDLCTKILRDEWGFNGVVVTDWGDMDIVVDGADAVDVYKRQERRCRHR